MMILTTGEVMLMLMMMWDLDGDLDVIWMVIVISKVCVMAKFDVFGKEDKRGEL